MAFQFRRGSESNYNVLYMRPGEPAVLTDGRKLKVCVSPGVDITLIGEDDVRSYVSQYVQQYTDGFNTQEEADERYRISLTGAGVLRQGVASVDLGAVFAKKGDTAAIATYAEMDAYMNA